MAKAKKKRRPRKPISDERLRNVLEALGPKVALEIREKLAAPPKPKKRSGRKPLDLQGKVFGAWTIGPRAPNSLVGDVRMRRSRRY
jgi:hypothetical protein